MKICKWPCASTQRNKAPANKHTMKSSGNEVHNENLQGGFTNTAITMESIDDDSRYTIPQIQSSPNIQDSFTKNVAEPENILGEAESNLYEEIPDILIQNEMGSGYLNQSDGYVPITEYSDLHLQGLVKQAESMQREDESGNTPSESQPYGYVPITEYSDLHLQGLVKQAESMQREDESGNTPSESQPYGYVPITEYSDTLPPSPQRSAKQEESMQRKDESGNTPSESQPYGYVPITEYPHTLPPSPQRIAKQATRL